MQRNKIHTRKTVGAIALVAGIGVLAAGIANWPSEPAMAAGAGPQPATAPVSAAGALPTSFADVVEKVGPAVVNIQVTTRSTPEITDMRQVPGNMREFFEHFFGQPGGAPQGLIPRGQKPAPARQGAGSGFVVDSEGHIVTNEHVIRGADEITVTFQDGTTVAARIVGQDDKTDLALLKIDSDGPVPYVEFGDSDGVRVGDWIVTVGNPFGLGHSVNVGIVSARGRTIGAGPYDDFLQIDAPINRGNSGGPAFDVAGNVIGVNAAIFSPNGGNVGIGFAIPSAIAEKVVDDLKANGVVERGWLGVHIQPINEDIAESLGRADTSGALIVDVRPDSPAAGAGLRTGDVILSVNGTAVDGVRDLPRLVADIAPGTVSDIVLWRDGDERLMDVKIGRQPETKQLAAADPEPVEAEIGLSLKALDPETARQLGLDDADAGVVVVGVTPGSPAAEKGLRPGDVLTRAGGQLVRTPADVERQFVEAREAGRKTVLALVKRNGAQRFIAIPVGAA